MPGAKIPPRATTLWNRLDTVTAKIAVVDDDPAFGAQLARLLGREGFTALAYDGGEAFLAALPDVPPDLVILDQMMPGATGMEVLRRLRATSDMPCIMLTGSEDEATRIAGLEGGADDYIVKSAPPARDPGPHPHRAAPRRRPARHPAPGRPLGVLRGRAHAARPPGADRPPHLLRVRAAAPAA